MMPSWSAVNPPDTPPEWGVVAVIAFLVIVLIGLFAWWVRAAREDLRDSHREFVRHLTDTGTRQTEAIVASAVATQQSTRTLEKVVEAMNRHDAKAEHRHAEVLGRIDRIGHSREEEP